MPVQFINQGAGAGSRSTGNHCGIGYDTTDSRLYIKPGDTRIPIAEVNAAEVVTTTNVITAAESGKTFFLNSTTEFVSTLPAVALGLRFSFIVKAAPSGASYTIVTPGGADLIHGVAASAADAGGSVDTTAGTLADTITFVDGQALAGDRVDVVCDGTYWYAMGMCSDEDAITFTQS